MAKVTIRKRSLNPLKRKLGSNFSYKLKYIVSIDDKPYTYVKTKEEAQKLAKKIRKYLRYGEKQARMKR